MINETGKRYGRLTVLRKYGGDCNGILWLCRCDCGVEVAVRGMSLRNGNTRSCGCYRQMSFADRRKTGLEPLRRNKKEDTQ